MRTRGREEEEERRGNRSLDDILNSDDSKIKEIKNLRSRKSQ